MPNSVSGLLSKSIVRIGRSAESGAKPHAMEWSLYDARGRRKYLVSKERWAFVDTALKAEGRIATFCAVLAFSGARISEVLALTPDQLDEANGTINFETLKRRRRGLIRAVPVPQRLFDLLDEAHGFRAALEQPSAARCRLWRWSRTTAWRRVKEVMRDAGELDHLSMPKALRHAFGAAATLEMISPLIVQKWMGHARIETTQIYTALVGNEERRLARSTWKGASRPFRL
jgi:integrase/recombinase XerD